MRCSRVNFIDNSMLADQWDRLADIRFEQITSGKDITYNRVLVPNIIKHIGSKRFINCLDVGCGIGVLTNILTSYSRNVVGIDISKRSICLARSHYSDAGAKFCQDSIETYAKANVESHDIVVANMFLMDTPYLDNAMTGISSVMARGGIFIAAIPHPYFWPHHYGYGNSDWYSYNIEVAVEACFHISLETNENVSIHFHRPLDRYISCVIEHGLELYKFDEIVPDKKVMALYPLPWSGPRYIVFACRKK